MRFPGQYYDEETGLHYNYHRYYDPRTGRYTTPDPIGQIGGINLYPYVLNNPINYIDPLGLQEWDLISSYNALHHGWRMPQDNKLSFKAGSSATVFFNNFAWDTSNPSKRTRTCEYLSYVGGAWHFILTTEDPNTSLVINVGLGKYFGMSFGEDYISINIGLGIATPVTITTPYE